MIYLKCALAGVLAVLALAALTVFALAIYAWIAHQPAGNGVVQWDPISLTKPLTLLVIIGVVLVGFGLEFRRVGSK